MDHEPDPGNGPLARGLKRGFGHSCLFRKR
jgi:hypothetical protein